MSMLSNQCDELRDRAKELCVLATGMGAPCIMPETKATMALAMESAAVEMREAADTIKNLRNRLQPVPAELDYVENKSRWFELFGTPERAARMMIENFGIVCCADCPICHDEFGETCEIPGRCVWGDCEHGYDALLEWLRGESE